MKYTINDLMLQKDLEKKWENVLEVMMNKFQSKNKDIESIEELGISSEELKYLNSLKGEFIKEEDKERADSIVKNLYEFYAKGDFGLFEKEEAFKLIMSLNFKEEDLEQYLIEGNNFSETLKDKL